MGRDLGRELGYRLGEERPGDVDAGRTACNLTELEVLDEQRRDKMTYFDTDDPDTKDLNPAMKLLDEILEGKK